MKSENNMLAAVLKPDKFYHKPNLKKESLEAWAETTNLCELRIENVAATNGPPAPLSMNESDDSYGGHTKKMDIYKFGGGVVGSQGRCRGNSGALARQ